MKIKIFFYLNLILFLLASVFVKIQTEITKSLYNISQKRKIIKELSEVKNILSYNLTVKSSLDEEELDFKDFKFAKNKDVFAIIPNRTRKKPQELKFFNVIASAQEKR